MSTPEPDSRIGLPEKPWQPAAPASHSLLDFFSLGPFLATRSSYTGISFVSCRIASLNRSARSDRSMNRVASQSTLFGVAGGIAPGSAGIHIVALGIDP